MLLLLLVSVVHYCVQMSEHPLHFDALSFKLFASPCQGGVSRLLRPTPSLLEIVSKPFLHHRICVMQVVYYTTRLRTLARGVVWVSYHSGSFEDLIIVFSKACIMHLGTLPPSFYLSLWIEHMGCNKERFGSLQSSRLPSCPMKFLDVIWFNWLWLAYHDRFV